LYRFSARDGLEDARVAACASRSDVEGMILVESGKYEEEGDASRPWENVDDASPSSPTLPSRLINE
jgi:hypothetical protein